jgi:hypothetical protein
MTAITQLLFYVSIAAAINGVANGLALFVTQLSPLSYSNRLALSCFGDLPSSYARSGSLPCGIRFR